MIDNNSVRNAVSAGGPYPGTGFCRYSCPGKLMLGICQECRLYIHLSTTYKLYMSLDNLKRIFRMEDRRYI